MLLQVRISKNDSKCEDVDECLSGISDCQHICINTAGGFNCECEFGYALHDIDRKTREKVVNVCALFPELNCSYRCRLENIPMLIKGIVFANLDLGLTSIIALAKISMNAKIQAHVNRTVQTLTARLNGLVPLDTFWKMI